MDTSGVLVAAKDAATANAINSQFQAKQVSKAYLALCLGVPEQQQFIVDGPIGQHPDVTVARKVVPDGQPAVTHVQVSTQKAQLKQLMWLLRCPSLLLSLARLSRSPG